MKSSPLIWRYVVNVKATVNISLIFVALFVNFSMGSICRVPDKVRLQIALNSANPQYI